MQQTFIIIMDITLPQKKTNWKTNWKKQDIQIIFINIINFSLN